MPGSLGHAVCSHFQPSGESEPMLAAWAWAPTPRRRATAFQVAKGYFDDMAVFNKFGHEISKPKLRPGGADTTPDCQKEDRLLTKRQQRLDRDLENLRKQFEPKLITAADIDGEDPLKAAIAEPPNFFKAGVNVEVMNPERPNSELLACLKEEGGKFELCEQKELGEDGHDLACDAERGEDFHWREGDSVKFLGTCIEPKPLKKALLSAETPYLHCVYPDGEVPGEEPKPEEGGEAEGAAEAAGAGAAGSPPPAM
ncbi:rpsQ [Symbiodinium microadriaticum]|nr:rpsQ [Symbiodinium sp. KB8]CAE7215461.1 rpsQ [Symbiodinium microadriaticum]